MYKLLTSRKDSTVLSVGFEESNAMRKLKMTDWKVTAKKWKNHVKIFSWYVFGQVANQENVTYGER